MGVGREGEGGEGGGWMGRRGRGGKGEGGVRREGEGEGREVPCKQRVNTL